MFRSVGEGLSPTNASETDVRAARREREREVYALFVAVALFPYFELILLPTQSKNTETHTQTHTAAL